MFPWLTPASPASNDSVRRLKRLEAKIDRILDHLGLPHDDLTGDPGLTSVVRELADKGQKIQAIKAYRAQTGAGLKESKDAVEEYLGQ